MIEDLLRDGRMVFKIRVYNYKSLDSLGSHAIKKVSVMNAIGILLQSLSIHL